MADSNEDRRTIRLSYGMLMHVLDTMRKMGFNQDSKKKIWPGFKPNLILWFYQIMVSDKESDALSLVMY